jgi:hypothetical protein
MQQQNNVKAKKRKSTCFSAARNVIGTNTKNSIQTASENCGVVMADAESTKL